MIQKIKKPRRFTWGEVLLIEDNPGDARLVQHALHKIGIQSHFHHVIDGEQALAFLSSIRPNLILLDLNLPRRDGHQVLNDIRSEDSFKDIPIFVLTSSELSRDIAMFSNSQASGYFTKPSSFSDYENIFHKIEDYFEERAYLA